MATSGPVESGVLLVPTSALSQGRGAQVGTLKENGVAMQLKLEPSQQPSSVLATKVVVTVSPFAAAPPEACRTGPRPRFSSKRPRRKSASRVLAIGRAAGSPLGKLPETSRHRSHSCGTAQALYVVASLGRWTRGGSAQTRAISSAGCKACTRS